MGYKVFKDSTSLINYSYKFIIGERLPSLQKDIRACLRENCAFPTLLYCFSTIDLMGALYTGYATEGSKTKSNFKEYVCRFMKNGSQNAGYERYRGEHADLLLDIFRHKIVHLAQPRLVINTKNRLMAWRYEHPETLNHLKIENIGKKRQVTDILTPYDIFYDNVFVVSITQLSYDIVNSVLRSPDGYFARLKSGHKNMQMNFDNAIDQIYSSDL
jgi:hypothetical protein